MHPDDAPGHLEQRQVREDSFRRLSRFRWFRRRLEFHHRMCFAFRLVTGIVFIHQHGGTDFVLVACLADDPDQVRARHFQLMSFAQVVELFKVSADHVKIP